MKYYSSPLEFNRHNKNFCYRFLVDHIFLCRLEHAFLGVRYGQAVFSNAKKDLASKNTIVHPEDKLIELLQEGIKSVVIDKARFTVEEIKKALMEVNTIRFEMLCQYHERVISGELVGFSSDKFIGLIPYRPFRRNMLVTLHSAMKKTNHLGYVHAAAVLAAAVSMNVGIYINKNDFMYSAGDVIICDSICSIGRDFVYLKELLDMWREIPDKDRPRLVHELCGNRVAFTEELLEYAFDDAKEKHLRGYMKDVMTDSSMDMKKFYAFVLDELLHRASVYTYVPEHNGAREFCVVRYKEKSYLLCSPEKTSDSLMPAPLEYLFTLQPKSEAYSGYLFSYNNKNICLSDHLAKMLLDETNNMRIDTMILDMKHIVFAEIQYPRDKWYSMGVSKIPEKRLFEAYHKMKASVNTFDFDFAEVLAAYLFIRHKVYILNKYAGNLSNYDREIWIVPNEYTDETKAVEISAFFEDYNDNEPDPSYETAIRKYQPTVYMSDTDGSILSFNISYLNEAQELLRNISAE